MAKALHEENFVAIRTLYPSVSWRASSRFEVSKPATSAEVDYRDLLSEANECFFHREYTVALEQYLTLREKILVQSHPELPDVDGITHRLVLGADAIEPSRLFELSRRVLTRVAPGEPVTIPAFSDRLFTAAEVQPSPALAALTNVGVDAGLATRASIADARLEARRLAYSGDVGGALKLAGTQADAALERGDHRLAADMLAEAGANAATYATDHRPALLKEAAAAFSRAAGLYQLLGDAQAAATMQVNIEQADHEASPTPGTHATTAPLSRVADTVIPTGSGMLRLRDVVAETATFTEVGATAGTHAFAAGLVALPVPRSTAVYLAPDDGVFKTATNLVTSVAARPDTERTVGILANGTTMVASLDSAKFETDVAQLYEARVTATNLVAIDWNVIIGSTFAAYIPQLFFHDLPLAIADTYAALGQYQDALDNYASVLSYPYLNTTLEVSDLWQRMARVQLRWGDDLFRRGDTEGAREHYETIVTVPAAVPAASPLYAPAPFAPMRDQATQVITALAGQPATPVNPKVSALITGAFAQLTKLQAGLNFLGLSDDFYPVGRFRSLQAAASYLADGAVTAEQAFIQFRSQAEQQKFERMQLETSVAMNQAALAIEQARLSDAALEQQAAAQTRQLTELRRDDAQANLTDWTTLGYELTSMDAALSWAANAANDQDITYTNVKYDGASHDYSGDVEDFFDTVGEKREWVNYDIQKNRLERQVGEAAAEVDIAKTREQQAAVRYQVQQLNVNLAQVRLDGSREILDYTDQRMFGEDLWFRLAADLEDLARSYLDMAIEAAFLMQRAYDLEFDRDLQRIRLDYGLSGASADGAGGLLGGDYLKRDIASFTDDYVTHARKQNPIRAVVSLREEFPQAFGAFGQTGRLEFHTDLELFDRRWPGTFRRKIKRVEVFVQGLIPTDGVRGTLSHSGVSTEWRFIGGAWTKHTRVLPAESMLISSYQYRRDLAVIQPPDDLLSLFENLGPQGTWVLDLPASTNDLDDASVSDISVVYYMDADVDADLASHTAALYGNTGARSFVLSSRFQYPDQWFRLDADRHVAFDVLEGTFPRFVTEPKLSSFSVRLIALDGQPAFSAQPLTISRASDAVDVAVATDANGLVQGDATTMAPFAAWKGASPVDTFTVAFPAAVDLSRLADVQVGVSYDFTYRPDAP